MTQTQIQSYLPHCKHVKVYFRPLKIMLQHYHMKHICWGHSYWITLQFCVQFNTDIKIVILKDTIFNTTEKLIRLFTKWLYTFKYIGQEVKPTSRHFNFLMSSIGTKIERIFVKIQLQSLFKNKVRSRLWAHHCLFTVRSIFTKWWPFFNFFIMDYANIPFLLTLRKPETQSFGGLVIWNFSVWLIFMQWWPFFNIFTMAYADIPFLLTLRKLETQTFGGRDW